MTANQNQMIENILASARDHGLHVEPAGVELNESGLDFFALFANTEKGEPWVIRKPRRPDVVESAAYEKRVLEFIQPHLPPKVPNWKVYSPELIAYPRLEGLPTATINHETKSYDWNIDPQSLPAVFVDSLAEAIASLHGIDHDAAVVAGIRMKQPAEVRQTLSAKMDEIKSIIGISEALWQRWQKWLADDTYWPGHSAMVHGDLHAGHIVVDSDGRVTGLLDWTEAEIADPATDFTIYYATFGESGLADLLKRYEIAGGRIWPRMRDHIVELLAAYPVLIATFALKSGLDEYVAMARGALGVDG